MFSNIAGVGIVGMTEQDAIDVGTQLKKFLLGGLYVEGCGYDQVKSGSVFKWKYYVGIVFLENMLFPTQAIAGMEQSLNYAYRCATDDQDRMTIEVDDMIVNRFGERYFKPFKRK
jgi:hypothetical protein